MRRFITLLSLPLLVLAVVGACSATKPADDSSAATTTTRFSTPSSTTTSDATSLSRQALAPVSSLGPGLLCRDLFGSGYDYSNAIAYWVREGQPSRMDADGDAVPCETVYDPVDVASFWGDMRPGPAPIEKPPAVLAELGTGLFCRDLEAMGFTFDQAVAYWMREGMTDRMDADHNGVPCETVFPATAVTATYGPPDALDVYLVTTVGSTPIPRFEAVGPAVEAGLICASGTADWVNGTDWRWEDEYICDDGSGTFVAGADIQISGERLWESWTILSGTGTYITMSGGGGADTGPAPNDLWQDHMYGRISNPGGPIPEPAIGFRTPGLLCREVNELGYSYGEAVAYWTREGMPNRMDADENGVPCETTYPASDVAAIYGTSSALDMYLVATFGEAGALFAANGPAVDAGIICSSGTVQYVGGHDTRWEDEYTCADGTGTFTAGVDIHFVDERQWQSWTIISGTDAYSSVTGGGGADTGPGTSGWQDHLYGRLERSP